MRFWVSGDDPVCNGPPASGLKPQLAEAREPSTHSAKMNRGRRRRPLIAAADIRDATNPRFWQHGILCDRALPDGRDAARLGVRSGQFLRLRSDGTDYFGTQIFILACASSANLINGGTLDLVIYPGATSRFLPNTERAMTDNGTPKEPSHASNLEASNPDVAGHAKTTWKKRRLRLRN